MTYCLKQERYEHYVELDNMLILLLYIKDYAIKLRHNFTNTVFMAAVLLNSCRKSLDGHNLFQNKYLYITQSKHLTILNWQK